MPKQRKYQPSLQEPKAKTEDAERRLALSMGRESVELPPVGFVSTIHKRFHRERFKIENGEERRRFWFSRSRGTENECDLLS
ncbi:unnamed protein product [Brassica rapa]|uniref:Uncharacterized protein n=1 Tax=Brassica campestris TaxID=3711 RepID=A0A8D9HUA6_BRACM|nr:unnamed protein product [Brassica rapa]